MSQDNHPTICVCITTYNEESSIADCIKSARLLSDSILVIDTESTDNTVSLAKKEGADVLTFPNSTYVEPSRNFALSSSKADWVFILDADERITQELADEVRQTIARHEHSHYAVTRLNIFAKKWPLKHGGWGGEKIIRLIEKKSFVQWPKEIHSTPEIKGSLGELSSPLEHLFHACLEEMVNKTLVYEGIEAELHLQAKHRSSERTIIRKFFGEVYRRLIKWKGYRDGTPGIIESIYQAYSKSFTYLLLLEKNNENPSR